MNGSLKQHFPILVVCDNGKVYLNENLNIELLNIDLTDNQKEIIKEKYITETGDLTGKDKDFGFLAWQLIYLSDYLHKEEFSDKILNTKVFELSTIIEDFLNKLFVDSKE